MRQKKNKAGGFTLVEVLLSIVIGSMVLGAVLSSFVFMAKSCVSLNDYTELDVESRRAVEIFSREVRASSDISGFSVNGMTLTVPISGGSSYTVNYTYVPNDRTFYRAYGTSDQQALLKGVQRFSLRRYNLLHNAASNDLETKQIQLDAETSRTAAGRFLATNHVLSARFVMRNKIASN